MVVLCAYGCGQETSIATQTNSKRGIKKGDYFKYVKNHFHPDNKMRIKRGIEATDLPCTRCNIVSLKTQKRKI